MAIIIFHVARFEVAMEIEEEKAVTDERILVVVLPHPLIKHWSFVLRNEQMSPSYPWRLFLEFFHPPLYQNQSFEEFMKEKNSESGVHQQILNWSFIRNDQPRFETCYQIALANKKEVEDLEAAGINNSKASYIRTRDAEENAYAYLMDSSSCSASFTNQSHVPLQVTDAGSPISAQTLEYEEIGSDNYQANSRYHFFVEMQQHGNGPVNDIHILDPYAPIPSLNHYDHQRLQVTGPASNFYSLGPEDLTRVFDEIGLGLVPGSKTQLGLASWEEVLENCRTGLESAPFDSTVASTQNYTPDNLEQYSLTLEIFTTDVGLSQVDDASALGWQDDAQMEMKREGINNKVLDDAVPLAWELPWMLVLQQILLEGGRL